MIRAAIFDMDGLLVDSEPYWKIAEKKIFGNLGLHLSDDLLRQVMGFRLSEVVEHWYAYQAWENKDFKKVEEDIIACMKELIEEHVTELPGVHHALNLCRDAGLKIALASSSSMVLIEAVIKKLRIENYFEQVCSAEFERYGKPHPDIFIHTAQKLGVAATECVVFEDSPNGMIAAKAARMKCIVVPEELKLNEPLWSLAELKLQSLAQLSTQHLKSIL